MSDDCTCNTTDSFQYTPAQYEVDVNIEVRVCGQSAPILTMMHTFSRKELQEIKALLERVHRWTLGDAVS